MVGSSPDQSQQTSSNCHLLMTWASTVHVLSKGELAHLQVMLLAGKDVCLITGEQRQQQGLNSVPLVTQQLSGRPGQAPEPTTT